MDKLVTAQCVTDDPAPLLQAAGDVLALADVLRPNATAQPFTTEAEQKIREILGELKACYERDRGQIQTAHNSPGRLQRRSRRVLQNPAGRQPGRGQHRGRAPGRAAGGWDENVACQDWGLWLRLAHHGKRHARRSHYLACRRIHGQQLTTVHRGHRPETLRRAADPAWSMRTLSS